MAKYKCRKCKDYQTADRKKFEEHQRTCAGKSSKKTEKVTTGTIGEGIEGIQFWPWFWKKVIRPIDVLLRKTIDIILGR